SRIGTTRSRRITHRSLPSSRRIGLCSGDCRFTQSEESRTLPHELPFGEPVQVERKSATDELTRSAEATTPSVFRVFAYISRDFAYSRARAEISGSREIIRGPSVTHWVPTGARTSRGKTLALSPRDTKRVNDTVMTAPRMNLRTRPISLLMLVW